TPIRGADTLPAARIDSIRARQARIQARRDSMTTKLMSETYAYPALTPAMPWLDDDLPPTPAATRAGSSVTIEPADGEPVRLWVVQARWAEGWWSTEIVPVSTRSWQAGSNYEATGEPLEVWVSTVDRVGNQSEPVRVEDSPG